ncbi:MAG: MazG nucleotide pyrophosphohydrolase domain-containing protein, partial [Cetobacterium sp.]
KVEIKSKDNQKIEEELGDLLFSIVNLSRHLKINPELCLNKASKKFEKRFRYVEKQCDFKNTSLKEMDEAWNEAKKIK